MEPAAITLLDNSDAFKAAMLPSDPQHPTAVAPEVASYTGYHNAIGGWAHATAAIEKLYTDIRALGGTILPGHELASLLYTEDGKDVRGVRCVSGQEFLADRTVVTIGSWTSTISDLREIMPKNLLTPTGQIIAAIQLTPEEMKLYSSIPVSMRLNGSGYYSFPPNEQGLLKIAIHAAGYLSDDGKPRTVLDPKAVQYAEEHQAGPFC